MVPPRPVPDGMTSTARRLLVSVPTLHDPNFFRTVVFMVEHTDDGALGVVLNQPTETPVDAVLEPWAPYAAPPGVAFVGGPVQQHEAVIGFGRVASIDVSDSWQPLLGRVGAIDLGRDPMDSRPDVEAVRIFAGYSGWAPGQLEHELDAGGWFVADADPDDLLTDDPAGLWRTVLRRQGGEVAVAANYPLGEEPDVN
jgi:putative transcriptional regulator